VLRAGVVNAQVLLHGFGGGTLGNHY
jgi:hypothetical protein